MKKLLFLAVIAGFAFLAYSFTTPVTVKKLTENEIINTTFPQNADLKAQMTLGEKLYKEKCVACHQADGNGIKGAFPPLKDSDYLKADPKRGISQVLNGSNEEMTVNGTVYKTPMPAQVSSKDEALAVINYVLKTFNGYSDDKLLKAEDIKDIQINK